MHYHRTLDRTVRNTSGAPSGTALGSNFTAGKLHSRYRNHIKGDLRLVGDQLQIAQPLIVVDLILMLSIENQ